MPPTPPRETKLTPDEERLLQETARDLGPRFTPSSGPPFRLPGDLPEQFGRYRIVKRLGRGGMGTVYLAEDSQLQRRVALKVPHFRPDEDPDAMARFNREARSAALLVHPNICPVYDVGEIDGVPYLSMAFIEGQPLNERLRQGPALNDRQAVTLALKLADALAEAHERGIIHRDLKPANVIVTQRGEPMILDFGLARRLKVADARLTASGVVLGTPIYMAPEQIADPAGTSAACDIYSLGVVLYEALTGAPPFDGPMAQVIAKVLTADPPRPTERRPDLDPRLEAICLKAMHKNPRERYASMQELSAVLRGYVKGEIASIDIDVPPRQDATTRLSADLVPVAAVTAVAYPERPRRWRVWLMGLAAMTAMVIGFAAVLGALAVVGWWGPLEERWRQGLGPGLPTEPLPTTRFEPAPKTGSEPTTRQKKRESEPPNKPDPATQKREEALGRLATGRKLSDQRRHAEAVAAFTQALTLDADLAEAYLRRGISRLALREYDPALGDLDDAVLRDDKLKPLARSYRSQVHLAKLDLDQALADADEAVRLDGSLAQAYVHRAAVRLELHRYAEALADVDEALRRSSPLAGAFLQRAQAYYLLADYERALTAAKTAVALDPGDAQAIHLRGQIQAALHNYDQALADFDNALKTDPWLLAAYESRIRLHLARRQRERALADADVALAKVKPIYVRDYLFRAWLHKVKDNSDAALEDVAEALKLTSKAAAAYNLRGEILLDKKELDKALADFAEALKRDPNHIPTLMNRGKLRVRGRTYDDSLADLDRILRLVPRSVPALVQRGIVHGFKRNHEQALADFNEAIRLDPRHAEAFYHRGQYHARTPDADRALADYTEALRLDPDYTAVYTARSLVYRQREEFDKALADLEAWQKREPRSTGPTMARVAIFEQQKEPAKAIAELTQALKVSPETPSLYARRAAVYRRMAEYDKALVDVADWQRLDPKSAGPSMERGSIFEQQKEYAKAIEAYSEAIRRAPAFFAYFRRGYTYSQMDETDKAIADYNEAIRLNAKDAAAWNNRGVQHWRKKDAEAALRDYNQAIELNPNNPLYYRNRASVHSAQGDTAKAKADRDQAADLEMKSDKKPPSKK